MMKRKKSNDAGLLFMTCLDKNFPNPLKNIICKFAYSFILILKNITKTKQWV